MSVSAKVAINDENSIRSTTIAISQTFESPLIEGNATNYEIVIPEKNEAINESLLHAAKEKKQRVAIRPGRLQLLLDMEKKLKMLDEKKHAKLELLHAKEKSNLTAVNERVKRYTEAHRDEINARRREQRKLSKEAASTAPKSNIIIIKRTVGGCATTASAPTTTTSTPIHAPIHVSISVKSSPTPSSITEKEKSTVSFS
jgi:hypothetical protein